MCRRMPKQVRVGPVTCLGVWSLSRKYHLSVQDTPCDITEGFSPLFLLAKTLCSVDKMWIVIVAFIMLLCTVI